MPSIFDFSAAGPWLLSGLLIGLLASWLMRKFSGADIRTADELATLSAKLDSAKERVAVLTKNSETLSSKATYYESEFNSLLATNKTLNQDLLTLQNNASQGGGEIARLGNELASTRAQLEKLRADSAAAAANTEKTYLDQIGGMKSQLASSQAASGDASRLTSELASTKTALEKLHAESNAAAANTEKYYQEKIAGLQTELTTAQTAGGDVSRLSTGLASTKAELEKLRAESAAAAANAEKTYQDQISGLKSQLSAAQSAGGETTFLKGELTRLTTELANSKAGAQRDLDAVTGEGKAYKAEAERLAKALAAAQSDLHTSVTELHTTKHDLHQVRSGLEETSLMVAQRHGEIEQLKSTLANMPNVETYKRFKDALEAANRIAAGLPDKA